MQRMVHAQTRFALTALLFAAALSVPWSAQASGTLITGSMNDSGFQANGCWGAYLSGRAIYDWNSGARSGMPASGVEMLFRPYQWSHLTNNGEVTTDSNGSATALLDTVNAGTDTVQISVWDIHGLANSDNLVYLYPNAQSYLPSSRVSFTRPSPGSYYRWTNMFGGCAGCTIPCSISWSSGYCTDYGYMLTTSAGPSQSSGRGEGTLAFNDNACNFNPSYPGAQEQEGASLLVNYNTQWGMASKSVTYGTSVWFWVGGCPHPNAYGGCTEGCP